MTSLNLFMMGKILAKRHYNLYVNWFSNKRHLHTMAFGHWIQISFSLGKQVAIITPSLSFAFNQKRFTEPSWLHEQLTSGKQIIRVKFDQS